VLKRCTTLQELLMLTERYYHLVTPAFSVRYVPGNRHCEWRIRVAAPMTQTTLHMSLEMHAVSMHGDLQRLLGADANADIYLSVPPPPHLSRYRRLPGTRFHFSAGTLPEMRCVLPAELVRRRLPPRGTDGPSESDIRAMPRSGLQPADSYGEWIGLMLREAQTVQPTLAELAALVNLSPRTLARKLSAEGINFRHLSTQIRHARACTMLADRHIPIHQIAYQLGYSDTTAFIRAFRRTGGITPALYRDRNG
jgi:AraC-like DNA-binding protein